MINGTVETEGSRMNPGKASPSASGSGSGLTDDVDNAHTFRACREDEYFLVGKGWMRGSVSSEAMEYSRAKS